jgi:hypothetical protein
MGMIDEWNALSARIRALANAARLQAAFLSVRNADSYNSSADLQAQAGAILAEIVRFSDRFDLRLTGPARAAVRRTKARVIPLTSTATNSRDLAHQQMWTATLLLSGFEAEMSYLMAGVQELVRARTERAFEHLQRCIVVDSDLRGKWEKAFTAGEIECEKLGALQLLHHGIWAFKVDAAGGRTDLVYQEPVTDVTGIERYVDGLVLTEWKKTTSPQKADSMFEQARTQARRYQQGVLGGIELTDYRFAIVVSKDYIKPPDDIRIDNAVFRHVNIAVAPSTPSKAKN